MMTLMSAQSTQLHGYELHKIFVTKKCMITPIFKGHLTEYLICLAGDTRKYESCQAVMIIIATSEYLQGP
jgi:hypothetical protein